MTAKGKFITLEGIEGAGKSTALQFISEQLNANHIPFVVTREPGGTTVAEAIRKILLLPTEEILSADAELLLIFAARAQHIARVIEPALLAGKWVISDRFTDATYAYQGGGRQMAMSRIAELEKWVQGSLKPDCVIVLDVPVDVGMERLSLRGKIKDRFEQEKKDFFERARHVYLTRAHNEAHRYRIVDATQELAQVQKQLKQILALT